MQCFTDNLEEKQKISHWTWNSSIYLHWLANKPQRSYCLHLSSMGITGLHHHAWHFTWVLGSKLRSWGLHRKHFTEPVSNPWASSQPLQYIFKKPLFYLFFCLCVCLCACAWVCHDSFVCGGQRSTCGGWFSSTTWVPGSNLVHQAWRQAPLAGELSS